jgi:hypothetical protein
MKKIIAIAAVFAFGAATLVQAQSTMEKIEKAGAANTKATAEAKAKKRADADAREKAAKEERDKNQGKLKAKMKTTADGVEKQQAEHANDPKPKH